MSLKKNDFIPLSRPDLSKQELDEVIEVLKSGWLTTGPKVTEFETALSNYLKDKDKLYSVGLNSCTSALFLALLAIGVTEGDEVIVPTWTFAATAHAVEWTGATLVLCDVEEHTLNIDATKASQLITARTKAIIPVHMAGYPCDQDALSTLAQKYNIKIIEDAAHAIGTKYNDTYIGNFADVTCFSFYATKNLAMGEGGAAVSKNKALIDKIRKLSYFGINKMAYKKEKNAESWFYDIEEIGYKSNLDSIHAALGLIQLSRLEQMNLKRRKIADFYRKNLSKRLTFCYDSKQHLHSYHLFIVKLPEEINRNIFIQNLKELNIGTSVHFIPLHMHKYYKNRFKQEDFEHANKIFQSVLSLPMCSHLNDTDISYIVETINDLL